MKIKFNITLYHGTNFKNIDSIIKSGFDIDSISCATQNKDWASGFGNTLISFKYPYTINLKDFFWFIRQYGDLTTRVSGFKLQSFTITRLQP